MKPFTRVAGMWVFGLVFLAGCGGGAATLRLRRLPYFRSLPPLRLLGPLGAATQAPDSHSLLPAVSRRIAGFGHRQQDRLCLLALLCPAE